MSVGARRGGCAGGRNVRGGNLGGLMPDGGGVWAAAETAGFEPAQEARRENADAAAGAGLVIGLLGPTGVGKTAVAMALAKRLAEEWPRPSGGGGELRLHEGLDPSHAALEGNLKQGSGLDPGRIISCDSMQVYRGFPVLTNQPPDVGGQQVSWVDTASSASADPRPDTADPRPEMGDPQGETGHSRADVGDYRGEMRQSQARTGDSQTTTVSHAAVGFVDPDQDFSVAQYVSYARPLIERDLATRGWALLVGGTGFYMRAALAPLAVAAESVPEIRARREARASAEGAAELHAELARLDPGAAAAIDPRNTRRVIRALEAMAVTGRPWSGREDLWTPAYYHPTLLVGLVMDRAELYRRIDLRAERMMREGAVEEVRRFRERRSLDQSRPGGPGIRGAIGYPEICRVLDGEQSLEDSITQVAAATRRYARRQLTWLRKVKDAVIIDVQDREPHAVAEDVLALARSADRTRGAHRS